MGPSAPGQEMKEGEGRGPYPEIHPIKERQRAVVSGTSQAWAPLPVRGGAGPWGSEL